MDTAQEQLHGALQTSACDDAELEDSVLVGWVTVAEWVSPDGERWLSCIAHEGAAVWQIDGYLSHALNGGFVADEDDD